MFNLLLVDDETLLLESMRNTDWYSLGIVQVFTAESGIEAVECLKKTPIDVVVTDIRMPGMNGIELSKYIQEQCPRTKCIILSGYADFEYARAAISNQVTSYLVKPARDKELLQAVNDALQNIQQEWEQMASTEQTRRFLHHNMPLLRSNLLNQLLGGATIGNDRLTELLQSYEIPFAFNDSIYLVLVRLEERLSAASDHDAPLFEYAVMNIAYEIFQEKFELWSSRTEHGYLALLANPLHPEPGINTDVMLEQFIRSLQLCCERFLQGGISIVRSPSSPFNKEQIQLLYRRAATEFRKLPHSTGGYVIVLSHEDESSEMPSLHALYKQPSLANLLEAGRFSEVRSRLDDVFAEIISKELDSHEYLSECYYGIYNAFSYLSHLQGYSFNELQERSDNKLDPWTATVNVERLRQWCSKVVDQLELSTMKATCEEHSRFTKKVHQFIEQRLHIDVSLQSIADYIGMHPAYLSAMYKQETGTNISDYIHQYRMEAAAYKLRFTEDKVYEIAQQIGLINAPYFSKLFKQHYGLSPNEYRDKYNREL